MLLSRCYAANAKIPYTLARAAGSLRQRPLAMAWGGPLPSQVVSDACSGKPPSALRKSCLLTAASAANKASGRSCCNCTANPTAPSPSSSPTPQLPARRSFLPLPTRHPLLLEHLQLAAAQQSHLVRPQHRQLEPHGFINPHVPGFSSSSRPTEPTHEPSSPSTTNPCKNRAANVGASAADLTAKHAPSSAPSSPPQPRAVEAGPTASSASPSPAASMSATPASSSQQISPPSPPPVNPGSGGPGPPPDGPFLAAGGGGSDRALLVLRARAGSARASLGRASSSLLAAAVDLGAKLNRVTGYDAIEQLKLKVDEATRRLADAREELRESKVAYEAMVSEQGDVQRQQMSLLQRKGSWQAADLERFTELCREEHRLEPALAQAKIAYGNAAAALEMCHDAVAEAVRERYSAETLWSDKIRRASTWWTAGLMALNLVSFMSVYLVMEPIKARRLRNHVEEVLQLEMARVQQLLASLEASVQSQQQAVDGAVSPAVAAAAVSAGIASESAGRDTDGASPTAGAQPALDVLGRLRQARQQMLELERGLESALEQSGLLPGASAVLGYASPVQGAVHGAASPDDGAAGPEPAEETPNGSVVGSVRRAAGEQQTPEAHAWHASWAQQLRRLVAAPEATTAAAAFVGAALGAGVLMVVRDRS